ncbi:MAG TPA: NAD(P)-dependent oxidoreductase [Rhodopirellula sp.]|nr:NAD(P)-dependent oxidoreductase [Rhodopirellula sp.]
MSDVSDQTMIFGCGYLGRRIARLAILDGNRVWATTRQRDKQQELASEGIQPIVADWTDRRTLKQLPAVKHLVICVSYDRRSAHNRYESQVGGLRNLLHVISPETKVCYISTTGVYHQQGGWWVDEASPTRPSRDGGRAHLMAESLLNQMRPKSPWTILRLSGIYGPGRIPRAADVIAGRPIASPQHGFLNLIHVDDAAEAVCSALRSRTQRLYVVSDDQPVVRSRFYEEIALQTGSKRPKFVTPDTGSPVMMRSESNKRIWNRRMKRDLLPKLQFPTYRNGLADILSPNKQR